MFGPDLFTESVSQSWQDVLSALRAHAHLSAYIEQCVWTFETLSARILRTPGPSPEVIEGLPLAEETSGCSFDAIFQDMGFDFDGYLLGMDDFVAGFN